MAETHPKSSLKNAKWVLAGILVVVGVVLVVRAVWPTGGSSAADVGYFSVDDGKTYFTDSVDRLPPFTRDGKQAYRAGMFTCDGGKTLWVGYLQRYTPQGLQAAQAAIEASRAGRRPEFTPALANGVELKRPGDNEWVKQSDFARTAAILNPKCPHGGAHQPQPASQ